MTSVPELRSWLWRNGYAIRREVLVQEDRLYVVLSVTGGGMEPLSPAEEWAGRQQGGEICPLRETYLDILLKRAGNVLEGLRKAGGADEELSRWEALVSGLEDMKKEWLTWQK